MLICPECPNCGLETEVAGRDKDRYYFECSCWFGVYVTSIPRDGSFDRFFVGETHEN